MVKGYSMEHGAWSMEFLDGYPLWHIRGAYLAFSITVHMRKRVMVPYAVNRFRSLVERRH